MSAENAVERIRDPVERFDLDGIWIRDDNFFVDAKRAVEICRGISGLGIKWFTAGTRVDIWNRLTDKEMGVIKKSGCDCVKFGGESGNDRVLEMIKKQQKSREILKANLKCKKWGIVPSYAFMIGFPSETYKEMIDTVDVMQKIEKDCPNAIIDALNMVTPHYGTELFERINRDYSGLMKMPEKLEDWQDWAFIAGNKHIWFDEKTRKTIQRISDTSVYMGNVRRLLHTIENPLTRSILVAMMFFPEKYFKTKWNHKWFGYDPMFWVMRAIRKIWLDY